MKSFETFLNDLAEKMGQGTLADRLGIDGAQLSRFRSSQGTISINAIERILTLGDGAVVSRSELRRLEDALEVVSDLWKRARKGNSNRKTRDGDLGG